MFESSRGNPKNRHTPQSLKFFSESAADQVAEYLLDLARGQSRNDLYAASWVSGEFARNDITYEHSERDRSALYADFLPLLTSGRARLLDSPRLVGQCSFDRRFSFRVGGGGGRPGDALPENTLGGGSFTLRRCSAAPAFLSTARSQN